MANQQDRKGFADVVDAYYESIFRGAMSVVGDKHLAEEIVQETFVSAFKNFHSFSGRSAIFSWLYGIMLNKYRDHCRKRKLLKRLGFVRGDVGPRPSENASFKVSFRHADPYAELARSEESRLLIKAVYQLPAKLREVVAMRYFDGLPLSDIAEILKCRLGTVKSRLSRARERLLQSLQKELT
jgi:RNA polymerase sigma-70 factor (ECF subfamily)